MSSQQQLEQSQQALIAVIKAATVSVNAVGTVEVQAALDGLKKAAEGAERRLKHDADVVRGTFGALGRSGNEIARQLATDVFAFQHRAAPEQTPAPVELPESAVVEDAPEQAEETAAVRGELAAWSSGRFDEIEGPAATAAAAATTQEVQPLGATTAGNGKKRRR